MLDYNDALQFSITMCDYNVEALIRGLKKQGCGIVCRITKSIARSFDIDPTNSTSALLFV